MSVWVGPVRGLIRQNESAVVCDDLSLTELTRKLIHATISMMELSIGR